MGKGNGEMSEEEEEMGLKHAEHCFAYLRPGIMCAGDTTLEGPDVGGKGTLQRWGRCASVSDVGGDGGGEGWRRGHGVVYKKCKVMNADAFESADSSQT
jgi:hypothetical protein